MPKPEKFVRIGRLAMREENCNWNAYYALDGSMTGAIPLGSIRMAAIANNPGGKAAFMDMMRDIIADIIEDETGIRPTWGGPEPAPEHERSGHA